MIPSIHPYPTLTLTLTLPYPTLPYPYPALPYPTLPYPYPTLPYPTLPLPYPCPTITLPLPYPPPPPPPPPPPLPAAVLPLLSSLWRARESASVLPPLTRTLRAEAIVSEMLNLVDELALEIPSDMRHREASENVHREASENASIDPPRLFCPLRLSLLERGGGEARAAPITAEHALHLFWEALRRASGRVWVGGVLGGG